MGSSTTGDPDGQALPNSMTQAPMPSVSAIPITSPVSYPSIPPYNRLFPAAENYVLPGENRVVLTQNEWLGLQNIKLENGRLRARLRRYGFAKAAMVSGIIIVGLVVAMMVVFIFGVIIEVTGLAKTPPSTSGGSVVIQSSSPSPTTSTSSPTSNVGTPQPLPSSQTKHAATTTGQVCIVIANGRRYCAQPAPSESGKACVVYPSGIHHCGTQTQGG